MAFALLMSFIFYLENYKTKYARKIFFGILLILLLIKIFETHNKDISNYLFYVYDIFAWGIGIFLFSSNYLKLRQELNSEKLEKN